MLFEDSQDAGMGNAAREAPTEREPESRNDTLRRCPAAPCHMNRWGRSTSSIHMRQGPGDRLEEQASAILTPGPEQLAGQHNPSTDRRPAPIGLVVCRT